MIASRGAGSLLPFHTLTRCYGSKIYCPVTSTQRSITARTLGKTFYTSLKQCAIPTVLTVAQNFWGGDKSKEIDGVRVVRCPEEYIPTVSCVNCGGVSGPLCARSDRNYIIGFTAHGNQKNRINNNERGGCYANGGNVNIHWERLSQKQQDKTDAEILREFVKTIPPRRILRHHIAGDIGKQ